MSEFSSLFGKTLIDNSFKPIPVDSLKGKYVGLYFSAHWCGPCRQFTPVLKQTYEKLQTMNKKFEIVFCSSDHDTSEFKEYFGSMPWKAIPYESDAMRQYLGDKFGVKGIPCFMMFNPDGTILNADARAQVSADSQCNSFPWGPKSVYDLLEGKLTSKTGTVNSDCVHGKVFGVYFSAHWCGPCRQFTPQLSEIYAKVKSQGKAFEIIFVTFDHEESEYNEYYKEMPWLSIPFGDARIEQLSSNFKVEGIPTLLLFDDHGKLISDQGKMILAANPDGYPWAVDVIEDLAVNPAHINSGACVVLFEQDQKLKTILRKVAKELANDSLHFYFSESDNDVSLQIRKLTNTKGDNLILLINIPDDGAYYKMAGDINEANLKQFIFNFRNKLLVRQQMNM